MNVSRPQMALFRPITPSRVTIAVALVGATVISAVITGVSWSRPAIPSIEPSTSAELDEALEIYHRVYSEGLFTTTDPYERGGALVGLSYLRQLEDQGRLEELFIAGDEGFEAELDRHSGIGPGGEYDRERGALRSRRLQIGDLGGLDSGSCRACHFVGGPDGSGSSSQVALVRSDGESLESATPRDPPHVMGVGYIQILARDIETDLQARFRNARSEAVSLGESVTRPLIAKGLEFGEITAHADGTVDRSGIRHIAPDLVVRPFGRKGRARDLVEFTDEAFQMHHGLQSRSRVQEYRDDPGRYLGTGPHYDPDGDGVGFEGSEAQAVLMAIYLSMLPVPVMSPPADPELAFIWARGRAVFEEIDCVRCHRPELRFQSYGIEHRAAGDTDFSITLDLAKVGQEPVPRRLDWGPGEDGTVPSGVPIHAFTDLRLHDLGPELADERGELLPDESWEIPAGVWLTRSLWGLADTAPYLHDGRAPTVHDAIALHGGDATEVRASYLALPSRDRRALLTFLMSLTRTPTLLVE